MINPRPRPVRSYVLREGRLTKGQRRALDELLPRYGLALPAAGSEPGPGTEPKPKPLDLRQAFGRAAPTRLEIGFGDGGALLEMAAKNPHCNFIGAEVHRPGVGRLLLQLEARGLANVRVFCDDGIQVLTRALAAQALDALYLYFPDPWPKKKHHKRRIVQAAFIELAAHRLATGARLHFATDWQPYAEQALERLEQSAHLENCAGPPPISPPPPPPPNTQIKTPGQKIGPGGLGKSVGEFG